ncbi:hypothetical protein ACQ4LE_002481, partial [Meloidogyne hapla]
MFSKNRSHHKSKSSSLHFPSSSSYSSKSISSTIGPTVATASAFSTKNNHSRLPLSVTRPSSYSPRRPSPSKYSTENTNLYISPFLLKRQNAKEEKLEEKEKNVADKSWASKYLRERKQIIKENEASTSSINQKEGINENKEKVDLKEEKKKGEIDVKDDTFKKRLLTAHKTVDELLQRRGLQSNSNLQKERELLLRQYEKLLEDVEKDEKGKKERQRNESLDSSDSGLSEDYSERDKRPENNEAEGEEGEDGREEEGREEEGDHNEEEEGDEYEKEGEEKEEREEDDEEGNEEKDEERRKKNDEKEKKTKEGKRRGKEEEKADENHQKDDDLEEREDWEVRSLSPTAPLVVEEDLNIEEEEQVKDPVQIKNTSKINSVNNTRQNSLISQQLFASLSKREAREMLQSARYNLRRMSNKDEINKNPKISLKENEKGKKEIIKSPKRPSSIKKKNEGKEEGYSFSRKSSGRSSGKGRRPRKVEAELPNILRAEELLKRLKLLAKKRGREERAEEEEREEGEEEEERRKEEMKKRSVGRRRESEVGERRDEEDDEKEEEKRRKKSMEEDDFEEPKPCSSKLIQNPPIFTRRNSSTNSSNFEAVWSKFTSHLNEEQKQDLDRRLVDYFFGSRRPPVPDWLFRPVYCTKCCRCIHRLMPKAGKSWPLFLELLTPKERGKTSWRHGVECMGDMQELLRAKRLLLRQMSSLTSGEE